MSAHAGVWNFDGKPVDQAFLARLGSGIEPYGPNCCNSYVEYSLGMVHHAFHTTAESCLERQPHVSARKNVITWDGRLDNREDLIRELRAELRGEQTDVAIVVAAYEKWGSDCLGRIIGDWALSIWDATEQVLVLARDYIGVRQLYYHLKRDSLVWCTHLASLVLQSKTQFTINDEYIAGYLALWPEADLTPYCEIQAVPPGSFVAISGGEKTIHKYYNLGRRTRIRYKTDREYEHHFLFAFRTAVKRRLRCTAPVLAELSGGLDSSSIVCMADDLIRSGEVNVPRLDTLSFYSAKEPDGDERPFFTKVEERLGRTGCHIDVQPYCKGDFFKVNGHEFTPNPGVLLNPA
jgi:asparagine synthase (glutamine-hydrolysing)